jgi:hypothetical protein
MVAHELVKAATISGACNFWLADFPTVLAELVQCDVVSIVRD